MVLALAVAAQAPVVEPAPAPARTVAVLPVTSQAVPIFELQEIQDGIRAEATALGASLQDEQETYAHMKAAMRAGAACVATSTDCLVKFGLLADVQRVVAPTAIARGDGTVLDLRLVDVERGVEERRVVDLLVGDDERRRTRLRETVARVMAPDRTRGAASIVVSEPDARVLVDGHDEGLTPRPGPVVLAPGERVVRVTKAGFHTYEATVVVRAGETADVVVDMVPLPYVEPPPVPSQDVRDADRLAGFGVGAAIGMTGVAVVVLGAMPLPTYLFTGFALQQIEQTYRKQGTRDGAEATTPSTVRQIATVHQWSAAFVTLAIPGTILGLAGIGAGAWTIVASATAPVDE